jgi:ribonuclease HI
VKYKIFADGASSGNPGPAGYGFVIFDENGNLVAEASKSIGVATNNVAEYSGVLFALKKIQTLKPEFVEILLDSELIVKQIKGEYKVRNEALKKIYDEVILILKDLKYEIKHIPRNLNTHADKLAKKASEGSKVR